MKEALNNAKVVLAMKADGETIDKIEAFVRARGCDGARYKIDPSIGGGIIIISEIRCTTVPSRAALRRSNAPCETRISL